MKVFLFFFTTISLYANPSWYYNLENKNSNSYIGYGSGKSEKEAKQNALVEIASQIKVKVDNSTTQDKKLVSGEYENNFSTKSKQETTAIISGYELVNMSFENGSYYVALKYENIPSLDKFAKKIANKNYTKNSIIQAIRKDFGKSLNLELIRKDKQWYIKHKNSMQNLDKKDFERFFVTKENKNIKIKTNKRNNILYENDEFYFIVKASKNSYVNILTIYEDGTVSILLKNIKVRANKNENMPDKDFEAVPIAGLIQKGVSTFDMSIAILSDERLVFDSFAMADDELIEEERYKNFDELLRFLDGKTYSTLKIVTKPR